MNKLISSPLLLSLGLVSSLILPRQSLQSRAPKAPIKEKIIESSRESYPYSTTYPYIVSEKAMYKKNKELIKEIFHYTVGQQTTTHTRDYKYLKYSNDEDIVELRRFPSLAFSLPLILSPSKYTKPFADEVKKGFRAVWDSPSLASGQFPFKSFEAAVTSGGRDLGWDLTSLTKSQLSTWQFACRASLAIIWEAILFDMFVNIIFSEYRSKDPSSEDKKISRKFQDQYKINFIKNLNKIKGLGENHPWPKYGNDTQKNVSFPPYNVSLFDLQLSWDLTIKYLLNNFDYTK